ncbi:hypothetical protein [Paraburkholderia sp. GAS32]|uniref:hypothetical protein n=1 Tax=Paraburkholderia sp. GAS32 TaxID=3035129 RepID=UPI003D1E959F
MSNGFFEVARNSTGLVDGREPLPTEVEARIIAATLAVQHGEAFQVWGNKSLLDVIGPEPTLIVVAGEGKRWQAHYNPTPQRYVVTDTQRPGYDFPAVLAAGLEREDAVEAVNIANENRRWHPTLIHAQIREKRAE